jgi:hypothetical protein
MKTMKALAVIAALFAVSACAGMRGTIGDQEVCMNEYLLGVVSLAELVSPCSKSVEK